MVSVYEPYDDKVNTKTVENTHDLPLLLPNTNPCDDPTELWALQVKLLSIAEKVLGSRDQLKKIYQPQFTDDGPMLRNTLGLDGAYTELSRASENCWTTALFEMAHETVHLLNPTIGGTNYLEEGIAVYFSLTLAPDYEDYIRDSNSVYCEALKRIEDFTEAPLETGRLARKRFGALSKVSVANLAELCPTAERELLIRLSEEFTVEPHTYETDPNAVRTAR